MFFQVCCVAFGGALGAVLRYLVSLFSFRIDFPFATFCVNVFGAFLIGFITSFALDKSQNLFLKTGFCGGLTTFSTFSLEVISFFNKGKIFLAFSYCFLSLIFCFFGVFLGLYLGKILKNR